MRNNVNPPLAILICTTTTAQAFAAASLTPLGILPGGSGSIPYAVSADGLVVVGHSIYNFSIDGIEAFRWTSDEGMVGLGTLPGGNTSTAKGVSADGSVIVGVSDGQAFRWTSGGGMTGLGSLPGGGYSDATDISADGAVIVGMSDNGTTSEAFRWTSGGGMVGLGDLSGGTYGSEATATNFDGSVIVGSGPSDSNFLEPEAFRWTSGGGMAELGSLPGASFTSLSFAGGVSGDGSVVVGWNWLSGFNFPDDYYLYGLEFFRWTSDGGMVGLGTLPGGDEYGGEATATNFDGSVMVGYNFTATGDGAFIWTSGGGMQRLWDVLVAEGVDPAADGWTGLDAAYDVSADGTTIVGSGQRNGKIEAFVAVIPLVPEPTGDFDVDGDVDGKDFLAWQRGESPSPLNPSDLANWQTHFGTGPGLLAATTSVPEPAAGAFALQGVSSILLLRRRTLMRAKKLKVVRFRALAGALTLMAAAPAAAIDAEPASNLAGRA